VIGYQELVIIDGYSAHLPDVAEFAIMIACEVCMKKLLLLIFVMVSFSGIASVKDWKIVGTDGDFWLQHTTDKNVKNPITKRTGKSSVVETKDVGPHHEIIIYYTGMAGTFKLVDIYYAQIFNKKTKKFLGDYPWEYKGHDNTPLEVPQPKWEIGKDSISISDEQTALKTVVKLN